MRYSVTSAPDAEPLETTDIVAETRARDQKDFLVIERKIKAARRLIEEECRLALITQTIEAFFDYDDYRRGILELPVGPVQSITSMTTYDESGNATTVSTSNYRLSGDEGSASYVLPGRVFPVSGGWNPLRADNGIRVVYVAGFGNAASSIPEDLVEACYRMAYFLWRNREDQIVGTTRLKALMTAADILHQWRPTVLA